jgi:hypothetical protein
MRLVGGIGMWTGRKGTKISVILVVLLLFACSLNNERTENKAASDFAWWYTIQFRPVSATVFGLDVRTFNNKWIYATVVDNNLLKEQIAEDDFQNFNKSALSFSLMYDLDGNGIDEEFFVGVYETHEGEIGRFIAIMQDGKLLQYFMESGLNNFSALLQTNQEVRWYKCMECGEFESINWNGESFMLE